METIVKEWGLVEKVTENAGGENTGSNNGDIGLNNATLVRLARAKDSLLAGKEAVDTAIDGAVKEIDGAVDVVAKLLVRG